MNILVVDDEITSQEITRNALESEGYSVTTTGCVRETPELDLEPFDLIICDFHMPEENGDALLEYVETRGPEKIVFRVEKVIKERMLRRKAELIERERELLDLENRMLVNWKLLYASKDVRHTEQFVENITRNINQSGGFLWLDLLESAFTEHDPANVILPREILDLVINSGHVQRSVFEQIEFVSTLAHQEYAREEYCVGDFVSELSSWYVSEVEPIVERHGRESRFPPETSKDLFIHVDLEVMKNIIYELTINAIKYSPPDTRIDFGFGLNDTLGKPAFEITVKNAAAKQKIGGGTA